MPPRLPPVLPHRRYALFYLLREIGTLRGPMGDFIDHVRAAGSPTQQLRLLNGYRPTDLLAGGASDEQWDAAVYATLDRAALLKRLLAANGGGGGSDASSGSSPTDSEASGGSAWGDGPVFAGPVVALLPRDRLGLLMLEATRRALRRPAPAPDTTPGEHAVVHVPLEARHTECLLTEQARSSTAALLADAVRAMLPRL